MREDEIGKMIGELIAFGMLLDMLGFSEERKDKIMKNKEGKSIKHDEEYEKMDKGE